MKVKSNTKKSDSRLLRKENKQYGIINYDEDNCYPQRIMLLSNSSPTTKACLEIYGKFIEGSGFKDLAFYKAIVNTDKQTMDKVLGLIAIDMARFRGFAIHCNITVAGKITEIYHVPFEHVRFASKTKKEETGFDYAVYSDWNKQESSTVKPDQIVWLNKLDLDPALIREQVLNAQEAETEYKGQLFYYSADEGTYPLASCDVVLESMFAEIQSDIKTTNNIENGFTAKGILVHKGKFEEDEAGESEERDEFEEGVEEFIGPEGSDVIVVDVDSDEEVPEFIEIPNTADDKRYEYTDGKVLDKIIRNYKLPKILLSVTDKGGFFNQEQVRDAVEFYNLVTTKERLVVEATFTVIALAFDNLVKPANGDYSVKPIEFKLNQKEPPISLVNLIKDKTIAIETKRWTLVTFYGCDEEQAKLIVPDADPLADKRLLVDILGVGGTQALQSILADAAMSAEQKKSALIIIFGLTEVDANALAGIVITTP